jgi:hypothetical protein
LHISREDDYRTAVHEFISHRNQFLKQ